jgi:Flp pilus assembly pilin Flp
MTKFLNNEQGSASVQFGLVLAFVTMMMLGSVMTNQTDLPSGMNKLNAAFVQQR